MSLHCAAIKSHGSDAGFSGSYESAEPGNPISMQFSNSYDNQSASTLMHKGPAGKALEQEGRFPNAMANSSKTAQVRQFYHFTSYSFTEPYFFCSSCTHQTRLS